MKACPTVRIHPTVLIVRETAQLALVMSTLHQLEGIRKISKRIQGHPEGSHSEVSKRNLVSSIPDPEAEIMKTQIESIQLEMASLKAELKQIRHLQEKVTFLESTVSTLQKARSKLENGQHIANNNRTS